MHKALMSLVLAATVLTPIAAEAQNRGGGERARVSQEDRGNRQARVERRESRQQARQTRQQARSERRAPARVERQVRNERRAPARIERQVRNQRQAPVRVERQALRNERRAPVRVERQTFRNDQRVRQVTVAQRRDRRNRDSIYPEAWRGNPNDPALERYRRLERQNQRDYRRDRRDDRRDWRQERREDRRDWRNDRRDRRDWRRDWNRQQWRNDRRYDWQNWRYRNRNIYRMPSYYSPYRNHRYSRFSVGLILQPLFYSQRYWISDPWQYRLPAAPYGAQWVRYYNDVLLVDVYTGEVIDVIYNFFW